jgi:hypothetical protein
MPIARAELARAHLVEGVDEDPWWTYHLGEFDRDAAVAA